MWRQLLRLSDRAPAPRPGTNGQARGMDALELPPGESSEPEYDESCMAGKDRLQPGRCTPSKWAKDARLIYSNGRVFGHPSGRSKTVLCAGLYARVSTRDQQTIPLQTR